MVHVSPFDPVLINFAYAFLFSGFLLGGGLIGLVALSIWAIRNKSRTHAA